MIDISIKRKGVDDFIHELFNGHTTFVIANTNKQTVVTYGQVLDRAHENLKSMAKEIPSQIFGQIINYFNGHDTDELVNKLYEHILIMRSIGMIVNNNDAITSFKIEKMAKDEETRKLKLENKLLAEELSETRTAMLNSKSKGLDAIG